MMVVTRAAAATAASTRRSACAQPPPESSPFVGSRPSPLVQAVDDPEKQWLANQLRGLVIEDVPAAPQGFPPPLVNNAPEDVPAAHGAYYGYNFGAPGPLVDHEPLFVDQAKAAGYVAPPPQRFAVDVGLDGYIYFMAKDQNGCRFLQQKFEEGKHHVDVIFEGIIDHIADLMTNSFANYLVQKLLDVCDESRS